MGNKKTYLLAATLAILLGAAGLAGCGASLAGGTSGSASTSNTMTPEQQTATAIATSKANAHATATAMALIPTATPVFVHPATAAACTASQLAAEFETGQGATGGVITGNIAIRNTSASWCTLQGAETFTGLTASGATIAGVGTQSPYTLSQTFLPPNMPPSHFHNPAPGGYLEVGLEAHTIDPNSTSGACAAADQVTPATFVVSIGGVSVSVANADPTGRNATALAGCKGVITADPAALNTGP